MHAYTNADFTDQNIKTFYFVERINQSAFVIFEEFSIVSAFII